MNKIKVPEGMLKAAEEAFGNTEYEEQIVNRVLEAALRWLSENHLVPTEDQIISDARAISRLDASMHIQWIGWWHRRMFLAPEPVPVEDWTERFLAQFPSGYTPTHTEMDKIWETIFPAAHGWTPPPFRDSNKSVAEVDARISDLIFSYPTNVTIQTAEDRIRRAYRRGHKDGSK